MGHLGEKKRAAPVVINETYTHDELVSVEIHKATETENQAILSWDIREADGSTRRYTERFMMSELPADENAAWTRLVAGLVTASVAATAAAAEAAEAAAAAEAAEAG
jgi:hypothetical protein